MKVVKISAICPESKTQTANREDKYLKPSIPSTANLDSSARGGHWTALRKENRTFCTFPECTRETFAECSDDPFHLQSQPFHFLSYQV